MTARELVEQLLDAKRKRAEEALRISGLAFLQEDRQAWLARAAEVQVMITDLEMLLQRLDQ